ncbi:hypothetical protein, partial [Chamaesiphon sp.]|uniref:hypothetical protein n=1 Tax=Chamaesiphon sp. TaxID=2814140 RepID=UPI003593C55A
YRLEILLVSPLSLTKNYHWRSSLDDALRVSVLRDSLTRSYDLFSKPYVGRLCITSRDFADATTQRFPPHVLHQAAVRAPRQSRGFSAIRQVAGKK